MTESISNVVMLAIAALILGVVAYVYWPKVNKNTNSAISNITNPAWVSKR